MRHLATIRKIGYTEPIEGKDRIVLAHVDGWQVIVQKDQFRDGDLCVYCEIDSVLPQTDWTAFLEKRGYRIRTMKMGGVRSEGIVFPLSILPNPSKSYKLGDDVTEVLGITKYDPEADSQKKPNTVKLPKRKFPKWLTRYEWFRRLITWLYTDRRDREFPSFVKKTDEERIQNIPYILTQERYWYPSEKVDGTSGTFAIDEKNDIYVCSRNRRLYRDDENSHYWAMYDAYDLGNVLKGIKATYRAKTAVIQGEIVGPGIQKNKYGLKEKHLKVFNIITDGNRWNNNEVMGFCGENKLETVPYLPPVSLSEFTVDEVLKLAHGQSQLADTLREGLVFRDMVGNKSFKAVDPEFLMKWKE